MGKVTVEKCTVLVIAPSKRIFGKIYIFKFLVFDSRKYYDEFLVYYGTSFITDTFKMRLYICHTNRVMLSAVEAQPLDA